MRHFALQRLTRLTLYATLAHGALACGADTDRGPPIGSPRGPGGPIVSEGGATNLGGQAGANSSFGGSAPGVSGGAFNASAGAFDATAGAFNASAGGGNAFAAGGALGSAGRDPFGVGGGRGDPFGIAGTPSASAGASSF